MKEEMKAATLNVLIFAGIILVSVTIVLTLGIGKAEPKQEINHNDYTQKAKE